MTKKSTDDLPLETADATGDVDKPPTKKEQAAADEEATAARKAEALGAATPHDLYHHLAVKRAKVLEDCTADELEQELTNRGLDPKKEQR